MPRGGRFTISTSLDEGGGPAGPGGSPPTARSVAITISDTGAGMSTETVARVFDPFFTTKEVGRGAGLGLSLVHGIIEECGGTIRVTSAPGQGTSFLILLPLAAESAAAEPRPEAS
jgi:signal transduction histidine kinase